MSEQIESASGGADAGLRLAEDEVVGQVMLAPAAVKRLIEPEEVAEAVAYLCSPVATSITGSSLVMDGGWTAH